MPERVPIPPKGQTAVEIEVVRAPQGCDVIIKLRSLTLAAKMQGDPQRAMVFAFRGLAGELAARGLNLVAALEKLPEPRERQDLSDG